jgi:hypothetical protein
MIHDGQHPIAAPGSISSSGAHDEVLVGHSLPVSYVVLQTVVICLKDVVMVQIKMPSEPTALHFAALDEERTHIRYMAVPVWAADPFTGLNVHKARRSVLFGSTTRAEDGEVRTRLKRVLELSDRVDLGMDDSGQGRVIEVDLRLGRENYLLASHFGQLRWSRLRLYRSGQLSGLL